jgi:hypothetical protein
MKSLFKSIILFCAFLVSHANIGQSIKLKTVVEHFTNSRCSVCASRNPGFYAALAKRPDVLHIAYHPSSPYSTCLFSTQNKLENDARTKYFDLYGGTPSFTINGEIKNSTEVQNVSIYNQYDNKTSPLAVNVSLVPDAISNDSLRVNVVISAVAGHNLSNLSLYVPMIEDTVFYNAPNNEKQHYDVFRKSFTGANPISFIVPKLGESPYTFSKTIAKNSIWNLVRLSAIAIIADNDKKIVQVDQSPLFNPFIVSSTSGNLVQRPIITITPNPTTSYLEVKIEGLDILGNYFISNTLGHQMISGLITENVIKVDVTSFPQGMYFLHIGNQAKTFIKI